MSVKFNILAASSLSRYIDDLSLNSYNSLCIKAIPGLSFNREKSKKNVLSVLKTNLFNNDAPVILWHDVISNSLSSFETVFESTASSSVPAIKSQLQEAMSYGVIAFCYLQRSDAVTILLDILPQITPVGLTYLNMKRIVRRSFSAQQLMKIHLHDTVEAKFLQLMQDVRTLDTLCYLPNKYRSGGKNRPSKRRWREMHE